MHMCINTNIQQPIYYYIYIMYQIYYYNIHLGEELCQVLLKLKKWRKNKWIKLPKNSTMNSSNTKEITDSVTFTSMFTNVHTRFLAHLSCVVTFLSSKGGWIMKATRGYSTTTQLIWQAHPGNTWHKKKNLLEIINRRQPDFVSYTDGSIIMNNPSFVRDVEKCMYTGS